MRLHRVELTAFGPYPRHESVDFDLLGADGLFLLHGDTGAGKTTLLDAVAFALFGAVPGARGEVKRLRCDSAAPDVLTEVMVEFTIQGHRLRVVRSPEYERAKRSGNGVTTQRAKASLTWVGEAPSGHSPDGLTRIDEVARTVTRLLGMTAAQFFQVVLLPQGEFARFLRSDTAEREQLLERLFGTQRFADVERWFRDTRAASNRVVQEGRQAVRELVARVAQAAGEEPPGSALLEPDPATADAVEPGEPTTVDSAAVADPDWLALLRQRLVEVTAVMTKQELVAREDRDRAAAGLRQELELAERVRRVRAAEDTLTELADTRRQRAGWADELAAARRAVAIPAAHRAVDAARAELAAARSTELAAIGTARAVAGAEHELPVRADEVLSPATAADLPAVVGRLRDEAGGLQPLMVEAEQQVTDRARLTALADRERVAVEASAALSARLASWPDRLAAARAELDAAHEAAGRLPGLQERVAELTALHADARRTPALQRQADAARQAAQAGVDRHQQARDWLLAVRQRRLDGMAAELAGALVAGQPCAVCGSVDHPASAAPTGEPVGEAEERTATAREQQAQQEREQASQLAGEAEQRLAVLTEKLAGRTESELAVALAEATGEQARAGGLASGLGARTEALATLEAEAESTRVKLAQHDRDRVGAGTDRAALAELVAARERRLVAARGDYPDVSARRAYLLTLAEALDRMLSAAATRVVTDQRHSGLVTELAAVVAKAGFADPAQALAAVRDEPAMADLEDRLAETERRFAAAESVLAEPELAGIRADTVVDLVAARQLAADTARTAEDAVRALGEAQRRERDVAALAQRLTTAWAKLAPVETEHQRLAALTEVVNGRGQNVRRMSLRSYVLAARLAEVAVAASSRLGQMSQGRYSFVHSAAAGAHGTRGGLGLDVLDDYSGQVRPAKTLSGGESFLASLSLALGLADVVAAETGGAVLDTLFVDEGFGTLDADTLDQVMNTLDELRANGRVIGLVSHVDELRQRIPVRLRVRKARTGSTLELTAGDWVGGAYGQ